MSGKVHPAIMELRKYLHQRGDADLMAFMNRWFASWLDVVEFEHVVSERELELTADLPGLLKNTDRRAFERIGLALGAASCVEKVEEKTATGTTLTYAVVTLKAAKKLVLAGS